MGLLGDGVCAVGHGVASGAKAVGHGVASGGKVSMNDVSPENGLNFRLSDTE